VQEDSTAWRGRPGPFDDLFAGSEGGAMMQVKGGKGKAPAADK
jgi:hypothetical protein